MSVARRPGAPVVADPLAFCAEEVARLEADGLGRRVPISAWPPTPK